MPRVPMPHYESCSSKANFRRWKRICGCLAAALVLAGVTAFPALVLLGIRDSQHAVAARTARRQTEAQLETAVEMWKVTQAALERAQQQLAELEGR